MFRVIYPGHGAPAFVFVVLLKILDVDLRNAKSEVSTSTVQVIAAEGEQKASRALRQASDVITESAAALQLRYLQASDRKICYVAAKISSHELI